MLIHVDSEQAGEQLINSRLAYVAVSRARYDAQIYTNDAENLGEDLSREVSKHSAIGNDENLTKAQGAAQDLGGDETSSGAELAEAQDRAVRDSMATEWNADANPFGCEPPLLRNTGRKR